MEERKFFQCHFVGQTHEKGIERAVDGEGQRWCVLKMQMSQWSRGAATKAFGGVSRAQIASLVQRDPWDLRSKIGMHHLCHCFGMESSEEY